MLDDCSKPSTSGTMSGEGIPHHRDKCMVHHLISKREYCSLAWNELNKAVRLIISKTLNQNGMFRAQSRLKLKTRHEETSRGSWAFLFINHDHLGLTLSRGLISLTNPGWVVREPVNADPGLKVNRSKNFSSSKMFITAYVLCSFRALKLKAEGQKI